MAEATLQKVPGPAPLVALTDDEQLFRDSIRRFADEKIRPLVRDMDEKQHFEADLIEQFFALA
jgi:hypothetical protein